MNTAISLAPLFFSRTLRCEKHVTYQVIGTNDVAVPTHFFKVITAEKDLSTKQWAYQVPNEPIEGNPPLSDFEVDVAKIEKAAGIIFNN